MDGQNNKNDGSFAGKTEPLEKTYRPKILSLKRFKYSHFTVMAVALVLAGYFISRSFASIKIPQARVIGKNFEVYDGEFLIKLRPQVEAKTNIQVDQHTVDPKNSGLNILNGLNKKNRASKLKKLIRKDQSAKLLSQTGKSDLGRWYKVAVNKKSSKRIISSADKEAYKQYMEVLK